MSEGQIPISGLDIRQTTIKTPHLVDLAVTTEKIAEVAVTIEKTNEPNWTEVFSSSAKVNSALTTTELEIDSFTVDIPSWVGTVSALLIGSLRLTNSSGGVQGLRIAIYMNGLPLGLGASDAASGGMMTVTTQEAVSISSPGATIEFSYGAYVASGTNSVNAADMEVLLVGVR